MAPVKRCCYVNCTNNSGSLQGSDLFFVPFPKPRKNLPKCRRWVKATGRGDFTLDMVKNSSYICSKHFRGGDGPTPKHQDPVEYQPVGNKGVAIAGMTPNKKMKKVAEDSDKSFDEEQADSAETSEDQDEPPEPEKPKPGPKSKTSPKVKKPTPRKRKRSPPKPHDPNKKTTKNVTDFIEQIDFEEEENSDDSNFSLDLKYLTNLKNNNVVDSDDEDTSYQEPVKEAPCLPPAAHFLPSALPLNWSCAIIGDKVCCNKYLEVDTLPVVAVVIDQDLTFVVQVWGKPLGEDHPLLTALPNQITSHPELLRVIDTLDNQKRCPGNPEEKFKAKFEAKPMPLGHFCPRAKVMVSKICMLLLATPKTYRCPGCIYFRKVMRSKLLKNNFGGRTNQRRVRVDHLSNEEVRAHLKDAQKVVIRLKCRNAKLQNQIDQIKTIIPRDHQTPIPYDDIKRVIRLTEQTLSGIEEPRSLQRLLLEDQLRMQKSDKKKIKQWHPEVIKWCIEIQRRSSQIYNLLRRSMFLPSETTLGTYYRCNNKQLPPNEVEMACELIEQQTIEYEQQPEEEQQQVEEEVEEEQPEEYEQVEQQHNQEVYYVQLDGTVSDANNMVVFSAAEDEQNLIEMVEQAETIIS